MPNADAIGDLVLQLKSADVGGSREVAKHHGLRDDGWRRGRGRGWGGRESDESTRLVRGPIAAACVVGASNALNASAVDHVTWVAIITDVRACCGRPPFSQKFHPLLVSEVQTRPAFWPLPFFKQWLFPFPSAVP